MIDSVLWGFNAAACAMVSWVAGCFLLREGRPRRLQDWAMTFGLLGTCVYSIVNAVTPLQWDSAPNLMAVMFRSCLAVVCATLYQRNFGWQMLWFKLRNVPRCWARWLRQHIDEGKEIAQSRQVHK